jgi:hypothetical protein
MRSAIPYVLALAAATLAVSCAEARSKDAELRAACKDNPTHPVCVNLKAKADAAKARKDARTQALIDQVKGK